MTIVDAMERRVTLRTAEGPNCPGAYISDCFSSQTDQPWTPDIFFKPVPTSHLSLRDVAQVRAIDRKRSMWLGQPDTLNSLRASDCRNRLLCACWMWLAQAWQRLSRTDASESCCHEHCLCGNAGAALLHDHAVSVMLCAFRPCSGAAVCLCGLWSSHAAAPRQRCVLLHLLWPPTVSSTWLIGWVWVGLHGANAG